MTDDRHRRVTELFLGASDLPEDERSAFLDQACGEDGELRAAVEKLLDFEEKQPGFLEDAPRLDSIAASEKDPTWDAVVERLTKLNTDQSRYRILGEVGRGGMGAILRVEDAGLKRTLAMKVILDAGSSASGHSLGRFLEEAQVTSQLDHPGIVPVHELGVDRDRRVYFTMKLVEGDDLQEIFARVRFGEDGWNQARALQVLLRVCEAVAFAHSKGVVHRDLKPANIMVGRFGEAYVMDWGLARVLGEEDRRDLRIRDDEADRGTIRTERQDSGSMSDSPLMTVDGHVVGTPFYMAPEQAEGRLDQVGPATDVYAMGSILYQLLTGAAPYQKEKENRTPLDVVHSVRRGPPTPVAEMNRDVPAELAAICERAMNRRIDQRYPDMLAVAEDLRAYLENRVVRAYRTGAWVEFRKWVARNPVTAALLAALVILLSAGLLTTMSLLGLANRNEAAALSEKENVLRLSAFQELADLQTEADALWPARPEQIDAYDAWLERARSLVAGLDPAANGSAPGHRAQLARLRERVGAESSTTGDADRWWMNQLDKLVTGIEAFSDPQSGWIDGTPPGHGIGVARRRELATTLSEHSVDGPEVGFLWDVAIESIADPAECPAYDGLELTPQLGLVPLGADPESGLWEFVDIQSGTVPGRDENDELILTEENGLVFVLLPGGTFTMGAQNGNGSQPNHDPQALPHEGPVRDVTLEPFFLSKYEMTMAQWRRVDGSTPSHHRPGDRDGVHRVRALCPVEQVSWLDCQRTLSRLGLILPTEAQWEYAARAGTDTPWWTGAEVESLADAANLCDRTAVANGAPWRPVEQGLDDGHVVQAPVGSYRPNPFGLHDVHGNLWEWCRDGYGSYAGPVNDGDGLRPDADQAVRINRGGSYTMTADVARVSTRTMNMPDQATLNLGVRPARRVRP